MSTSERYFPRLLWIRRIENSPTSRIGTYSAVRGRHQFFACVVATLPPHLPCAQDTWAEHKRWYAVLHRFSQSGLHVGTDSWFAGVAASGEDGVLKAAHQRLAAWLTGLGAVAYKDIRIRPFSTTIEGHTFGLIDESRNRGFPSLTFVPNDLLFHEPWDGDYDT